MVSSCITNTANEREVDAEAACVNKFGQRPTTALKMVKSLQQLMLDKTKTERGGWGVLHSSDTDEIRSVGRGGGQVTSYVVV